MRLKYVWLVEAPLGFVFSHRCGFPRLTENEVLTLPTEVDSLKSIDIQDYKGANVGFFRILEYFTDLYDCKYDKTIKKMIKGELSTILDAPLTSLFHGIIQVAYGYVSGADLVGEHADLYSTCALWIACQITNK